MSDFSVQSLIEALRTASDEIRSEVGQLAAAAAERTAARVAQAYPQGPTGILRSRVAVGPPRGWTKSEGALVAARVVRATAPHVHFVEEGIAGRRRVSPRPTFVPTAIEERQAFLSDAQVVLARSRELV